MFSVRITSNLNAKSSPFLLPKNSVDFSGAFNNKNKTNLTNNKSNFNADKNSARQDINQLIKNLDKKTDSDYKIINGKKVFSQTSKDKVNGFLKLAGSAIDKNLESIKSKPKYKYKEVSSKIRSAKTSVSAAQALIAAKRTVSDIKKQLQSSKEDKDELQIALSHAKRMEMAARKKKKHLETEELVENVRKIGSEIENENEGQISEQEIRSAIVENSENELEDMEDEILEEREVLSGELSDSMDEGAELSEEMMCELNSMIAEFGEEELKQLEENMEMLENIEVIDPHMSDEDFKKLKTKHRNSEEKTMVKADMEYLKDMIKLLEDKGAKIPITTSIPQSPVTFVPQDMQAMTFFEVSV